jgi:ubiquinone/menaquinone biosynthesis C-methylase UbiE
MINKISKGSVRDNIITVTLEEPSHYQGPEAGSWVYRLYRIKLTLAYYHHRSWLYRCISRNQIENAHRRFIAEVGCGSGYFLSLLEKWFPKSSIIGFDYNPRLLNRAKQQTSRCLLIQGNAEKTLPFFDGSIAALIILHAIEHLYQPEFFISEAARVLTQGGILLIATPNPTGIGARVMRSQWTGWREDHVSLYSPKEWICMFEKGGFNQVYTGTTGLSGIPVFRKFPLAFLNYLPLLLFGTLPWDRGEAFVGLFRRNGKRS